MPVVDLDYRKAFPIQPFGLQVRSFSGGSARNVGKSIAWFGKIRSWVCTVKSFS